MKKIKILLCGIGIACVLSGCGRTVELTEEENEIITEYAVGLLLKYDKYYSNHLVELAEYEEEADSAEPEPEEEEIPEESPDTEESEIADTPVVDMAEEEQQASTIEEFYGIEGIGFQYTGYELRNEYPEITEGSMELAFAMEATSGMKLLVLRFQAINLNGAETELNMMNYGTRIRVAVNGESPKSALSTMLLNDLQTYKGIIGPEGPVELVAVIEVPDGTNVENLSIILRNDSDSATLNLQ
ncbi:MAG: hypothetical protein HFI51_01245 [Lachnospiraceae bacterium]|nr:hypothetical protein [Lachnospiraceae bacterium]